MRALIATLCLCLFSSVCLAEAIYRWTGADGRVYYGDLPPPGAGNVTEVKSSAAKRAARTDQTTESALPDDELAARADDCARKREQVENYRNAARLVEKDNLGREREYSDEERQLLIARTEAEIDVLCGGS